MALFSFLSSSKDTTSSQPESQPPQPPHPQPEIQSQTQQQQSDIQPHPRSTLTNSSKLLIGGTAFFVLSAFITRRSLSRRRLASMPPYYTTASHHQPTVHGPFEAIEALNIATINVLSLAMLGVGGAMKAFDVNTLDDMRRIVRGTDADDAGRRQAAEEEIEEWIASVLERKADKEIRKEGKREDK